MFKNTKDIILEIFFFDYSYGSYKIYDSCPIRLVPTAKDIRLLGKFQSDSFKTERLVCVEADGQTDMARSTRLYQDH